jgi:hypothetical protein
MKLDRVRRRRLGEDDNDNIGRAECEQGKKQRNEDEKTDLDSALD